MKKEIINEIINYSTEKQEDAFNNPGQVIKVKDNTINTLVNNGVKNLPMMVKKGHLRENILTKEEAKQLGYSIKNKHFHGLGIKKYIEVIDSLDNPKGVYQYTENGNYGKNNYIIVSSIKNNNEDIIVPVEIENIATYNKTDTKYNRIKSIYSKNNKNYINNMINSGQIVDIKKKNHMQSNSTYSFSTTNNIPHQISKVNEMPSIYYVESIDKYNSKIQETVIID